MRDEDQVIGDCAVIRLEKLLENVERETTAVVQQNDIPITIVHFNAFRELVKSLAARVTDLQKHVDSLSYEIIPTLFTNQGVKTITLPEIGRVTINVRWSASMLNKEAGMQWLRDTGNEGLIITTVNAGTLSSFAKAETLAGKPLPSDLFKVGTAQHVSITSGFAEHATSSPTQRNKTP